MSLAASSSMHKQQGKITYRCRCRERCARPGRPYRDLSRKTWNLHAEFRLADMRAPPALDDTRPAKRVRGCNHEPDNIDELDNHDRLPSPAIHDGIPDPESSGEDSQMPPSPILRSTPIPFSPPSPPSPTDDTPTTTRPEGIETACSSNNPTDGQGIEADFEEDVPVLSAIGDFALTEKYIARLKNASIDDPELGDIGDLLKPPAGTIEFDMSDPDEASLLSCMQIYLSHTNSSKESYNETMRALDDNPFYEGKTFSWDQVKRKIEQISGVRPIISEMCPNSCVAYTGHLAPREVDKCPVCGEPRFHEGKARQKCSTIPVGPVIQAMKRGRKTAEEMDYLSNRMKELLAEARENNGHISVYDDICCGKEFMEKWASGEIRELDTIIMGSFDGCQIYEMKQSDCWIFIWIVVCISPCRRYKKQYILPGGIFPGPRKPKLIDTFLYIPLLHIAAVNCIDGSKLSPPLPGFGLPVWDPIRDYRYISRLWVVLGTADGPGMTYLNGLVGHTGKMGCRLWCGLAGRHRENDSHYYPLLKRPDGFNVAGCDHPDESAWTPRPIDQARYQAALAYVKASINQADYEKRRLLTGICRPSIFAGLGNTCFLGIPNMFPGDIMHLIINLADLLMNLFRGKFKHGENDPPSSWPWAVFLDETIWRLHGGDVARCIRYLPGSFDRPPRNPAEKINSGYKAWEWLLYLFGLGPALFLGVFPDKYWESFCKLVAGIRLLYQRSITPAQIQTLHTHLVEFTHEFESMYVQGRVDRMHFARQSIHNLSHAAPEIGRIGPGACSSQWPMERGIGDFTGQIRQHTNGGYANLAEIAARQVQNSTAQFIVPQADKERRKEARMPRGAKDIGDGYTLLTKRDPKGGVALTDVEEISALRIYLDAHSIAIPSIWKPRIRRSARMQLPSGQVARSVWKEASIRPDLPIRIARNVKIPNLNGVLEFAEVQYFFEYRVARGQ